MLDTEGLFAYNRNEVFDSKLFLFTACVSSMMVYNSFGVINESAIEKFHFIINLGKHITLAKGDGKSQKKGKSSNPEKSSLFSEMTNYFPHLIWLLRDFSLKFDVESQITSDDYMEKALLPREDWEPAGMKTVIRTKFKEVFPKRNCVTLVRPVNDEKLLRNIEEVAFCELREEFRGELASLLDTIRTQSKVKRVKGRGLDGTSFGLFLKQIAESLNSDSFPGISTVSERLGKFQRKQVVKAAVGKFKERVLEIGKNLPMEESVLGEKLEEIRIELMTEMQTEWVRGGEWREAVEDFKKRVRPFERELFEDNLDKSREINAGVVSEVLEKFRCEVQMISKELDMIEPKVEDLESLEEEEDEAEEIREQSRLSLKGVGKKYFRRATRSGSLKEKMVKLTARGARSTKRPRRSCRGNSSRM